MYLSPTFGAHTYTLCSFRENRFYDDGRTALLHRILKIKCNNFVSVLSQHIAMPSFICIDIKILTGIHGQIMKGFRDHGIPTYAAGRFCGVVVITSALHAEGREFEPRQNLSV